MERQIPADAESALAEIEAITDSERETWLDYAGFEPIELTAPKIAIIATVPILLAALFTGFAWVRHNVNEVTVVVLSIIFLIVFLKVIAPWIDRRQLGVDRPLVPPREIRSEVWRFQAIMFIPMMIGVGLMVPAMLIAGENGEYRSVAAITFCSSTAMMVGMVWWARRLARRIQSGWRPSNVSISDVVAALMVLAGLSVLAGFATQIVGG